MKIRKPIYIAIPLMLMLVCSLLPFVFSAGAYTINAFYNFSNSSIIDGTIYKTDSIVLRIKTPDESTCVYGTSSYPYIPFEGEYGLTHDAYLMDLGEGFHKYYIRCGESSNPVMEIGFATSVPIYATIYLSENPPLKGGKYKINLITSKTSLETPTLEYSFNEIVYNPISLKGSGENWEGNLIVPDSAGDAVCSFRFKAKDLSGEEGTKIAGDNSFIIDTNKPPVIGIIDAIGYQGQIKLNWFFEEEFKEFNIYKSENSQVEYTDFYDTSSKEYFYDNDVEKGKTYYYRVAGVDEAGNIGDLSREVYATALLSNYSEKSGLDPKLIGKVDNSLSEINSVMQDIEEISELMDLKEEKTKSLFIDIKLDKELDSSIAELNSLKRDVEKYKLQDLSEEELENKLASATLKLNIIKKKVPEDITITDEKESVRTLDEENIQKAFLEYSSNSEYEYKKEISETLKIIEEKGIKITSNFYILEIMYLDGTTKKITLVENYVSGKIGDIEELYLIEVVPKEIAERSSELKIMNLDYSVIKDDPVISFKSDTGKIIYYLNKETDLESLEEILIVPIKIPETEVKESNITGRFVLGNGSNSSWGIIVLALFAFILGIYFLKMKRESSIKPVLMVIEDIKKSRELIKKGKGEEAKELYNNANEEYKLLSEKEKKMVLEAIKRLGEENPK